MSEAEQGWTPDPDADPARWATELWLIDRLRDAPGDPDEDATTSAGIDAAQQRGALSAEAADAWRERLAGAPLVRTHSVDELPEAAAQRLEQTLAKLDEVGLGGMATLSAQITALIAVGVLSAEEARIWIDRGRAELGLPPLTDEAARRRALVEARREVQRVAVGARAHGPLQVIEVVWFASLAEVQYALEPSEPQRRPRRWEATDDLGTRYRVSAVQWGWSGSAESGRLTLQPAPPVQARWLELATDDMVAWVVLG